MKRMRKRGAGIAALAVVLCALALGGCARKYEPVSAPTLEEASGGISTEDGGETAVVSIEGENDSEKEMAKAGTSAHNAAVTTETARCV